MKAPRGRFDYLSLSCSRKISHQCTVAREARIKWAFVGPKGGIYVEASTGRFDYFSFF